MKKVEKGNIALLFGIMILLAVGGLTYTYYRHTKAAAITQMKSTILAAQHAVAKAEKSLAAEDIVAAQEKIDTLENESDRVHLQEKMKQLDQALEAEKFVAEAEVSQTAETLATAQVAVDGLANAEQKVALQARLDAVSQAIALKEQETAIENLVVQAEYSPSQEVIATAQVEVDKLTDEAKKSAFQARLDAVSASLGVYVEIPQETYVP
ncbi:hypothetical protein D3X11_07390 [Streptococcus sp. X16XC17]|uniref:GA-like domain-containing protein n=1 Tax=unclassified Streptococcus TaxID=2608887 RepID=UPI00066FEA30|nr:MULTISPECIES: hypothetical protein [unclassified Streptococcus]TCD45581.1 hypothetical protein D3X11_07390 [Streptococcus sp. X16XC17]